MKNAKPKGPEVGQEKKRRFKIAKLEERIAPGAAVVHGNVTPSGNVHVHLKL